MIRFSAFLIEKQYINLSKKAYDQLSDDAKQAIDHWETVNWTGGALEQHVKANDHVAQEIELVFAPIRKELGPRIKLYRGLARLGHSMLGQDYVDKKFLESWTDDKKVAEGFAGLRGPNGKGGHFIYKVFTDTEIKKAVDQYNKTGFVAFNKKKYSRYTEDPKYFNIWDMGNNHLTVSDDIEHWLKSDNDEAKELNAQKLAKVQVLEENINTKDIIWITNKLGSKEFIVRKSRH